MYSVKETGEKTTCPTESDEMNLKRIVRYLKGAPSAKKPDRNHYTSEVRERVHRQRLGRPSNNVQKHKWRELCSGETKHSQRGHEHSKL